MMKTVSAGFWPYPYMQKIFDILPVTSESDATVHIEGATGTGKDIMAKVIHNASKRAGKTLVKVKETLLNHDYPGNIRELENILEHALIICQEDVIDQKHLPLSLTNRSNNQLSSGHELHTSQYETLIYESPEKHEIIKTLEKYNWNKGQTAKALDINRSTLWRKMKKFGIFFKS